ncbi:NADPH-dependent glutamate synthase [bacterium]|nr:NADPH-dependent glutamate synthase [bacterium]
MTDLKEQRKTKPAYERHSMPQQPAEERVHNFREVPIGYTAEMAMHEAERCLDCKKPLCIKGCPVEVDIPAFIRLIAQGKFVEAAWKIKETNSLPAICGRVCPQEEQCEVTCVIRKKYGAVAIGRLERFVADFEREQGQIRIPEIEPSTGKKIAVVGSGPSGLTVAGDLVKRGHEVVIFEALHSAGGVLVYGIPEFRLPKAIVKAEVNFLEQMGVTIKTNHVVGLTDTIDELFGQGFDAIFIGTGAGAPWFMNIPGENLNGIYSANEFLTRSNLMKAYLFPEYDTPIFVGKHTAVIGGGNTAMDAARTSLRLGAEKVFIVYRRSRTEMPARHEEVEHGQEEGLIFHFLTNPVRYIGNEEGRVVGMECIQMELGEPDASGRRRPVPKQGSEFTIDVDTVIVAIGNGANPLIQQSTPNLVTNKWGNITADPETGQTSIPGVFAGGDIVTGGATVILAMGAGKKAARAIHEYIMTKNKKGDLK